MTETPVIHKLQRESGVAGQFAIVATVEYPDEGKSTVRFIGSHYGGPVVMETAPGVQVFVTDPERFGKFGQEWVRRFFA